MVLKLYNTLGRKKQVFKPIKKSHVGLYGCGLTVYNYGHIGNYRTLVGYDILKRYLEFKGFKVKKVVNITDVDDKTIRESIKKKKKLGEYTKIYEKAFFEDEKTMNILPASKYPKATDHIKEMIVMIEKLLEKGLAYKADDGIYFNVKKFKDYGKLSGVKVGELKAGASKRVGEDEYDKDNVRDFALWKFYDDNDGDVVWNAKFGRGRPGWHIECSAMSTKYLGEPFDIHTGGVDLIFPHHENEIAQSEGCCDKKFSNYWSHIEWLMVDGKKMSKSLGNYYTVRDIVEKGYDPLALRYFYLTGHYRTQLNFTLDNLKNSGNSLKRLKSTILGFNEDKKVNDKYLKEFEKAMDNDLDTVKALQILWELVKDEKASGKINTIKKMDEVFGLDLLKLGVPKEIKKLANEREKARKNKEWKKSDELREKINKKGFEISDNEDGSSFISGSRLIDI